MTALSPWVRSFAAPRRISIMSPANAPRDWRQCPCNIPFHIGFGVLATDTIEQAVERAGTKAGNKGVDATLSVLEMVSLLQRLEG